MLFRGRLGNMLESSWSPLAALWRPLEASWGSLGAILGPFWSHLRASWGHLGAPLQPSWDQLEGQRACRACPFHAVFLQVARASGHICVYSSYFDEFVKNTPVFGTWPWPPVNYRMDSLCLVLLRVRAFWSHESSTVF